MGLRRVIKNFIKKRKVKKELRDSSNLDLLKDGSCDSPDLDPYDKEFYDSQCKDSFLAASYILSIILDHFPNINRVIDVGCGIGTWLAVAKLMGRKVHGEDGHNMPADQLLIEPDEFCRIDLSNPLVDNLESFDLSISMEVIEHLPPESGDRFIDYLCSKSDFVLFSGAIPDQGGTNHVNMRFQQYWIESFARRGYKCFDVIRPLSWNLSLIPFWYSQNAFIFVRLSNDSLMRSMLEFSRRCFEIYHDKISPRVKIEVCMDNGSARDASPLGIWPLSLVHPAMIIRESEATLSVDAQFERCLRDCYDCVQERDWEKASSHYSSALEQMRKSGWI